MNKNAFIPRLTIPESGNPYYNTKSNGGYSRAIKGKPTEKGLDVLRNCVGYANGRYAEIQGLNRIQYQLVCNAEQFISKATSYGLTVGTTPKLGSIIVWSQGITSSGNDGAGHVAIVEQINADGSIVTSESGYGAKKPFWTKTRNNKNRRWGQGSTYTFLGFIYNPAVEDDGDKQDITEPEYTIARIGEGLIRIAKRCGISFEEIKRLNPQIKGPVYLVRIGQKVRIR